MTRRLERGGEAGGEAGERGGAAEHDDGVDDFPANARE